MVVGKIPLNYLTPPPKSQYRLSLNKKYVKIIDGKYIPQIKI